MRILTNETLRSTGMTIERGSAFTDSFAADATAFFRNGNTITVNGRVINGEMWDRCVALRTQAGREAFLRRELDLASFDYHDFKLFLDDLIGAVPSGSVGAYQLSAEQARRHGIVDATRTRRVAGVDVVEIVQRRYGTRGELSVDVGPAIPAPAAARVVRTYPSSCAPPPVCPPPPACPAPTVIYRDPPSFSSSSSRSTHSAVDDATIAPEL